MSWIFSYFVHDERKREKRERGAYVKKEFRVSAFLVRLLKEDIANRIDN